MIERKKYLGINGLDEGSIAFNDVDFCLKLLEKDITIYISYVELYHYESISVGTLKQRLEILKNFRRNRYDV